MEPKIQAYLDEYYSGLPAFLFGSRVNGHSNSDSDWDVGVIGAKRRMKIDNIEFIPIDVNNLDRKAMKYIFHRNIFSFAKKIKPLKKENFVRNVERKVKEHIIQYTMQKSGKQSISGEDIVTFYIQMNSINNPAFRQKAMKFLENKEAIKISSEDYDKILVDFKPSEKYTYRDYNKLDYICYFIEEKLLDLGGVSNPSISKFFNYMKNFVNKAATMMTKSYLLPNPTIKE